MSPFLRLRVFPLKRNGVVDVAVRSMGLILTDRRGELIQPFQSWWICARHPGWRVPRDPGL